MCRLKLLIHSQTSTVAVEVWEWISNFSSHFIVHVIAYTCCTVIISNSIMIMYDLTSMATSLNCHWCWGMEEWAFHSFIGMQLLVHALRCWGLWVISSRNIHDWIWVSKMSQLNKNPWTLNIWRIVEVQWGVVQHCILHLINHSFWNKN